MIDVARYADTYGFSNDSERSMWRWRDWVIDASNTNLPYNRFIVHQLVPVTKHVILRNGMELSRI